MYLRFILLGVLSLSSAYGDTKYRLNTPIRPSAYQITITPYFDTGDERAFTFDGEVVITFYTVENTRRIQLHSEDLGFNATDITLKDGINLNALNQINPLEFDKNYTFVYINLENELQVNKEYTLSISYIGVIRNDLQGFYRNYYLEKGVRKWLGATQMEPTHARKVFPCLDEPEYKATFVIAIDRPKSFKPSLSNTGIESTVKLNGSYVRETFYPTPIMSTYLVAFLVSEFEAAMQSENGTHEFGIFTRPEAVNQSSYAFDFGQRVVKALSDYFGINYYSVNEHLRLDHVALVNFRAGAMENWGLIKYRESLLLYLPEESTPYFKYRVAQIMAHETTHMWFGNLVTCHWWSNTWLNEGFANYFQDYITSLVEPDVASGDMLVIGSMHDAYAADEIQNAPAITNVNVNSPEEISAHFGTISYQKAGSVIRMIHHLIGDDAFRIGLKYYLEENKFNVSNPDKIYEAFTFGVNSTNSVLEYSDVTLTDVMSTWISQAGHPVLKVNIDYEKDKITLTQKRFYTDASISSNEIYKIPITYTTEAESDFWNTKPKFVMTNKTHELTVQNISNEHSWVLFNIQETGFYRVNYDDHSWKIISDALKKNHSQIHYLNRAKIVNDLFSFLYSDEVRFELLHNILDFLQQETHYAVWNAAIRGLNKLRRSYLGTDLLHDIDAYTLSLLENIINKLGYKVRLSDDIQELRNRMQVLELACKLGHQGCIDNSLNIYKAFKDNGTEITPSLRPVAYCTGLRFGGADDYDFLWKRMATTNIASEARIIGDILGCTTVEAKLKSYLLSTTEEDSPIKLQDVTVPLESILSNYSNAHIVMEELKTNYSQWSTLYPSMETVTSAVAAALHTQEEMQEYENWLNACTECSSQAVTSGKAMLVLSKASAKWAETHRADILQIVRSYSGGLAPSLVVLLFSVLMGISII